MATNKPDGHDDKNGPREKTGNGTKQALQESTEKPQDNDPSKDAEPAATIMPPAD